jgi:hypothetical protein
MGNHRTRNTMNKTSWKTTTAGVLAIAAIVVQNWFPQYQGILNTVTGVAISLGLIAARDNNVTSEDVGAK